MPHLFVFATSPRWLLAAHECHFDSSSLLSFTQSWTSICLSVCRVCEQDFNLLLFFSHWSGIVKKKLKTHAQLFCPHSRRQKTEPNSLLGGLKNQLHLKPEFCQWPAVFNLFLKKRQASCYNMFVEINLHCVKNKGIESKFNQIGSRLCAWLDMEN